uniref:SPIN90/Ldb17 leucine-rich domain-containing protein n=1 Tax=Anopheles coluzzii TaxID=1518534 RepID=A0A8W7Q1X3_ANOCL
LRADFIIFLLNIIETPPESDVQEVLPDIMINLILSFNLQFDNFAENVVLEAMEQFKTAKTFTEKILLLINREGKLSNFFIKTWINRLEVLLKLQMTFKITDDLHNLLLNSFCSNIFLHFASLVVGLFFFYHFVLLSHQFFLFLVHFYTFSTHKQLLLTFHVLFSFNISIYKLLFLVRF